MISPPKDLPSAGKPVTLGVIGAPSKGNPFGVYAKPAAPAKPVSVVERKTSKIPNLTQHVALARAGRIAGAHGGLLPPAELHTVAEAQHAIHQTIAERRIAAAAAIAKTIANQPGHTTPLPPSRPIQIGAPLGGPSAALPHAAAVGGGLPPSGRLQAQATAQAANRGSSVWDDIKGVLDTASRMGGTAIEGAASVPGTFATVPSVTYGGSGLGTPDRPPVMGVKPTGLGNAIVDVNDRMSQYLAKAQKAGHAAIKVPHNPVSFLGLNAQVQAALTKAGYKKGDTLYADDLAKIYGNGYFGATTRKALGDAATANGWPATQIPGLADPDLSYRAVTKFHPSLLGFLQNATGDVSVLASGAQLLPMAASAITRSIEQRSPQPLVRTGAALGQQWVNHLPVVGNMPFWENAYFQPFTTATSVAPVAKFAGLRAGIMADRLGAPGLSGEREVTLPTTGEKVTVPTTQNILTRPIVAGVDRLLPHSLHPNERAVEGESPTILNRLGHRIENTRYNKPFAERALTQSKLEIEHEPRLVLNSYLKAVKDLPTTKRDLLPFGHRVEEGAKVSDKQTRAETIIRHAAVNTSSDALARFYRTLEARSRVDAELAHGHAATHEELAQEAADSGESETALNHSAVAAAHTAEATHLENVAHDQALQATYSEKNPVNLDTLNESEQRLAAAAREVSQEATAVKSRGGKLGATAAVWGDLQHRLTIISTLEGKDSATPTAAGALADATLAARKEMLDLEAKLSETAKTRGQAGLSTSAGAAARNELGKLRALEPLLRDVQDRLSAASARHVRSDQTTERQAGKAVTVSSHPSLDEANKAAATHQAQHPENAVTVARGKSKGEPVYHVRSKVPGGETAAETAAARARISPGSLRTVREAAQRALKAKREERGKLVAAEARSADRMEAVERGAHAKVAGARVDAAQRALDQLTFRAERLAGKGPSGKMLEEARNKLQMAKAEQEHGFTPSRALETQRASASIHATQISGMELDDKEMAALAKLHLKPAELAAANKVELEQAIHEAAHGGSVRELNRLAARLEAQHAESSARFEDLSGSQAKAQLAHEAATARYEEGLKKFDAVDSTGTGRNPFHIVMRMPGERSRTQPVRLTTGEQFSEGNYTPDIHLELARDLEGHTKIAVEARLFEKISASPYVIDDALGHSAVPPGFVQVDKDVLASLRKPWRDASEANDVMEKWVTQGKRRAPGEKVTPGNTTVLISRDMHDWITQELRSPHHSKGVNMALQFTNMYRRWMLFTLPRTLINNAIGNPILAMAGGAGIMDYIRAIKLLREHPELIPVVERHRGAIANAFETAKLTGYQAFWRNANVFHEDLGRLTVYVHHAIKEYKSDNSLAFYKQVDMASEHMTNYLSDLAEGKNPKVHDFIKFADDWFGNMAKRGKYDTFLSTAVLFHKWVGHMIALTLWRMPTKYPGRTALLYNLANMADQYRKEHGQWPQWAQGLLVLWHRTNPVLGSPQTVGYGMGTQGWLPWATPAQSIGLGSDSDQKGLLQTALAANANPALRIALETLSGRRLDTLDQFKDTYGNTLGPFNPGVLAQSVVSQTPLLSTAFPRTGLAGNASQLPVGGVPGLGWMNAEQPSYSAASAKDPSLHAPSVYHHGFLLDTAARAAAALGLSPGVTDEGGIRSLENSYLAYKAIMKAASEAASKEAKIKSAKATP